MFAYRLVIAAAFAAAGAAACAEATSASEIKISAEAVYAWRSGSSSAAPIIVPNGGGRTIYNTDLAPVGQGTGLDIRASGSGEHVGLEARFLGGFGWTGGPTELGALGDVRIGDHDNFGVIDDHASVSAQLDTAELDATLKLSPALTVFAGPRRLASKDKLTDTAIFGLLYRLQHRGALDGMGPAGGPRSRPRRRRDACRGGRARRRTLPKRRERISAAFLDGRQRVPDAATARHWSAFAEAGISLTQAFGALTLKAGYRALYIDKLPTGASNMANATAHFAHVLPPVYDTLLVQAITAGAALHF